MLTADTLLHTVSPMLHPLLHPPAPTSLCCTAEHRQMFNSPRLPSVFSPFSLPHVCRAQHRPSIPPLLSSPSLPPFSLLHLSASLCSATLLCSALPTYSTPSAGRRRKAKGKHTHTHTDTPDQHPRPPCVHTGSRKALKSDKCGQKTSRNLTFSSLRVSSSLSQCLCPC